MDNVVKETNEKPIIAQELLSKAMKGDLVQGGSNDIIESLKTKVADWVSSYTGNKIAEIGTKVAKNNVGLDDHEAAKWGRKLETSWRVGLPVLAGSWGSLKNIKRDLSSYGELSKKLQPALTMSHGSGWTMSQFFKSDLEVVQTARSNAAKKLKNTMWSTGANLVALAPLAALSYTKQWVDDLKVTLKNGRGKAAPKSGDTAIEELHQLRLSTAESTAHRIRGWMQDLEPQAREHKNTLAAEGMNILSDVMTGNDLDFYSGDDGPYNLLNALTKGNFANFVEVLSGGVASSLRRIIGAKGEKEFQKPSAEKMIFELQLAMQKKPSRMMVHELIGQSEENSRLGEYIEDIFRQHEKDRGRAEIPGTVEDQLKAACQEIAEAMTDPYRQLHPQALAILTDKAKGILEFEGDKVTGVIPQDELATQLQELSAFNKLIHAEEQLTAEEFYEKKIFTREEFEASWDGLSEDEKFIWSSFFPDEVLFDIGVAEDEIAGLRAEGNEYWQEVVEATFDALKDMNVKQIKELGLSQKQANEFSELMKHHIQGRSDELIKHRHQAMDLTAQIGVSMQRKQSDFISTILEKGTERRQTKAAQRRKKAEESFVDKFGASKQQEDESVKDDKDSPKEAKIRKLKSREKREESASRRA